MNKKNSKYPVTKKDREISELVDVFITNGKKYLKLEADRQAFLKETERIAAKMQRVIDDVNQQIERAQEKLEKLGVDKELMYTANGYHGRKAELAAIRKLQKLIIG